MSFLDRLLGPRQKQRTVYDDFVELATPLVVNGYRRITAERGCAPGPSISDAEIIDIYRKVGAAFQHAARARGEFLPSAILNRIVLIFLQMYQTMGRANPAFFAEHIAYEASKYQQEGLRNDYKQELSLFNETPLWHKQIPQELQFSSSALVTQLEALRQELGLDHEMFSIAVMQSKNMTRRSVHLAYNTAKRTIPNRQENEYLAITIADRVTKKIAALPFNSSPAAWTGDQLQQILDQAESFAETCKDINGVCALAIQIEDYEGTFNDPRGIISRIDELCSEYGKRERSRAHNA